jgi:hypothetical protein
MACDATGPLWRQLRDCAMLAINDAVRLGQCAEMPRLILHDGVNDGAFNVRECTLNKDIHITTHGDIPRTLSKLVALKTVNQWPPANGKRGKSSTNLRKLTPPADADACWPLEAVGLLPWEGDADCEVRACWSSCCWCWCWNCSCGAWSPGKSMSMMALCTAVLGGCNGFGL